MTLRRVFLYTAFSAALALSAGDVLAAAGGGGSAGSRGSRSYSAPSATPTAPRSAAPMERSISPQAGINTATAPRAPGGFFSGGLGRGLIGGFLGAGLFGLMFGNGMLGGLGGIMSILGLIVQIGLVVLLVRFAIGFFRRKQPQFAGARVGNDAGGQNNFDAHAPAASFRQASGFGGGGSAQKQRTVEIIKSDYDAFERKLSDIQSAYSSENIGALRGMATPEMASYFEQDLSNNRQRGQVNRISDVRLLQGDLAESWGEADGEYATLAMRFSMRDAMVDINTGKVVSGSLETAREATELWTFRRPNGAPPSAWNLSAIQQAR